MRLVAYVCLKIFHEGIIAFRFNLNSFNYDFSYRMSVHYIHAKRERDAFVGEEPLALMPMDVIQMI